MFIVLSPRDPKPMYQQVIDQIKEAAAGGELKADEKLPSVRELAQALNISVITVKRAYMELEKDGHVYTRPGLGSYVGEVKGLRQEKLNEFKVTLTGILDAGRRFGISKKDIVGLFNEIKEQ